MGTLVVTGFGVSLTGISALVRINPSSSDAASLRCAILPSAIFSRAACMMFSVEAHEGRVGFEAGPVLFRQRPFVDKQVNEVPPQALVAERELPHHAECMPTPGLPAAAASVMRFLVEIKAKKWKQRIG